MATRGTGKTYEEILAEENATGKKTYDEAAAKTKETAAQKITNQNAVIDSAAQNTTAQYQKTIDEAPKRFAGQLDDNYIDELVARKNLENSMADMGLTDSGLNRGQQTAISVMRGNADAKTRQQQQDFVSAAQQTIDQVLAEAEREKASYANEVNTGVEDYLAQLWATVQQNAQANATSRFNAQEESLDAAYKAQLEAEAEAEKRAQEWAKALLSQGYMMDGNGNVVAMPKDNTAEMNTYAMTLIKEEVSPDEAWADARYRYGAMSAEESLRYQAKKAGYSDAAAAAYAEAGGGEAGEAAAGKRIAADAHNLVDSISFEVSGWKTFWRSAGEGDGRLVGEKVKELLEKNETYKGMSTLEKSAAASFAIAKSVEESFPNENQEANLKRIRRACEEYTIADYEFAVSYYLDNQGDGTSQPKQQTNGDAERVSNYYRNVGSMPGRLL